MKPPKRATPPPDVPAMPAPAPAAAPRVVAPAAVVAPARDLEGRRLLLGVGSSIAEHRALDFASALVKRGAEAQVVMTPEATHLIQPLAFEAITRRRAVTSLWDRPDAYEMEHLEYTKWANLFVLMPATANLIAKAALGIADDAVTTMLVAWRGPVVIVPAMNPAMWANPVVAENVERLRRRGAEFIGPVEGPTACGDVGVGRMAAIDDVIARVADLLKGAREGKKKNLGQDAQATGNLGQDVQATRESPLAGRKVIVTSGPTREFIDPVRFLSNPSSGKMGHAIAEELARRGARVTLVHGPVAIPAPEGLAEVVPIVSAEEMCGAVCRRSPGVDVLVFAAAVSDWRPAERFDHKQKKEGAGESVNVSMIRNPDIAKATLECAPTHAIRVGFAAESERLIENAEEKRREKRFDLLVANDVTTPGGGFASDFNQAWLLGGGHEPRALPRMTKADLARLICDEIERLLPANLETVLGDTDAPTRPAKRQS